jgi:hypothetical protein
VRLNANERVKKMTEFYFIDDLDVAQELTKDAVIKLAKKYGKDIVDHIFVEKFTESDGITYQSIREVE